MTKSHTNSYQRASFREIFPFFSETWRQYSITYISEVWFNSIQNFIDFPMIQAYVNSQLQRHLQVDFLQSFIQNSVYTITPTIYKMWSKNYLNSSLQMEKNRENRIQIVITVTCGVSERSYPHPYCLARYK